MASTAVVVELAHLPSFECVAEQVFGHTRGAPAVDRNTENKIFAFGPISCSRRKNNIWGSVAD